MDEIRQYLMSLIAVAIICSIIHGMFHDKSTYGQLIGLLTGIVMLVVLLSPLKKITIPDWAPFQENYKLLALEYTEEGVAAANSAKADIIKAKSEAYILDKAASLDAHIYVDVTVSQEPDSIPVAVTLRGAISPYGKQVLEREIETQLGILKENQQWS